MIRILLCLLAAVIMLVLSIPVLFVEWLIGKKNPRLRDISSLRFVQGMLSVVLFLSGTKVTVKGKEHIPTDRAVLYVCNHRSIFDIVIGYTLMPSLTGYVAKIELEKIPLLSTWMRRCYCLFLDRKDLRQGMQTILKAIEYVKSGVSICIFPEGTRSKEADEKKLLEFHDGSLKIAARTGCPVIPMAISNSSAIFEDHLPFIHGGKHVMVSFGEPICPSELDKEALKKLGSITKEKILEMLLEAETAA